MWVIFVLSTIVFAIAALGVAYVGNCIINKMRKDNKKTEKEIKEDNKDE